MRPFVAEIRPGSSRSRQEEPASREQRYCGFADRASESKRRFRRNSRTYQSAFGKGCSPTVDAARVATGTFRSTPCREGDRSHVAAATGMHPHGKESQPAAVDCTKMREGLPRSGTRKSPAMPPPRALSGPAPSARNHGYEAHDRCEPLPRRAGGIPGARGGRKRGGCGGRGRTRPECRGKRNGELRRRGAHHHLLRGSGRVLHHQRPRRVARGGELRVLPEAPRRSDPRGHPAYRGPRRARCVDHRPRSLRHADLRGLRRGGDSPRSGWLCHVSAVVRLDRARA